jgi:hypothetical protein
MKKLIAVLLPFCLILMLSSAQDEELNCYQKYAKKFEERGAKDVEDGWHEDVIITFRQGSTADCYIGKVRVEEGAVTQVYIRNADGSYDLFKKQFKHETKATITNGISKTLITVDDELINVVFPSHINPPKKKYLTAPDPDDL